MPYKSRTIKEIPKWLDCPLCGVYQTLNYNYLMNHFRKCEEYEDHIDDVEMYNLDDNTTVGDYIQQKINLINTIKKLIQTNELENIQNQSLDQIELYIKNKLLENINTYNSITTDSLQIYEFFFGESEISRTKLINNFVNNWFNSIT
jgi:hypothetical protein